MSESEEEDDGASKRISNITDKEMNLLKMMASPLGADHLHHRSTSTPAANPVSEPVQLQTTEQLHITAEREMHESASLMGAHHNLAQRAIADILKLTAAMDRATALLRPVLHRISVCEDVLAGGSCTIAHLAGEGKQHFQPADPLSDSLRFMMKQLETDLNCFPLLGEKLRDDALMAPAGAGFRDQTFTLYEESHIKCASVLAVCAYQICVRPEPSNRQFGAIVYSDHTRVQNIEGLHMLRNLGCGSTSCFPSGDGLNAEAQYRLALLYSEGAPGVVGAGAVDKVDIAKAVAFAGQAATQGHELAADLESTLLAMKCPCGAGGVLKCACGQAYCCSTHQFEDWKEHKNSCRFRIRKATEPSAAELPMSPLPPQREIESWKVSHHVFTP